jgi:cytoskeletal protein CcmA (bactofilin family)
MGKLAGAVECSGDLSIRSHGRIVGNVQCRHLKIQKGAHVEFLSPVIAQKVNISGNVRGQIFCSGTVTLEKRARLHGLVSTTSLIVKPGAKHEGTIEVITPNPTTPA